MECFFLDLGGVLKLDFNYDFTLFFGGEEIIMYRDSGFFKTIIKEGSNNSPIYIKEKDGFSYFVLKVHEEIVEDTKVQVPITFQKKETLVCGFWKLYFDGAYSKEGNGVGVLLLSQKGEMIPLSYKMDFDSTYNITKYEALIIGM